MDKEIQDTFLRFLLRSWVQCLLLVEILAAEVVVEEAVVAVEVAVVVVVVEAAVVVVVAVVKCSSLYNYSCKNSKYEIK